MYIAHALKNLSLKQHSSMLQESIKTQVEIINRATEIATKSKEAALKFLVDAGIVPAQKITLSKSAKNSK